MKSAEKYKVTLEELKKSCNFDDDLNFCSSSIDAPHMDGVIGQSRAVRSMQFGLSMNAAGYNIFVVGSQGTGKSSYTQAAVTQAALKGPKPEDWCYINNFNEWDSPIAVSLPAGQGKIFQKDMDKLIQDLKIYIPKAFEGSDFEDKREKLSQSVRDKMEEILKDIEKLAFEAGFSVKQAPSRILLIPLVYGRQITPEEYNKLPVEERLSIDEKRLKLGKKIDERLKEGQVFENQAIEQNLEIEKKTAYAASEPLILKLKEKYKSNSEIVDYLDKVLKDVVDNHINFRSESPLPVMTPEDAAQKETQPAGGDVQYETFIETSEATNPFAKYTVNLFINNENVNGAPVVIESNPTYYNIFGKIEYKTQMFSSFTDFTMIKPGSIHRANGGYLILQAKDILMDPFVWDSLKKALKYGQISIENIGEQYRLVPTASLKPEPIPLKVKVIIIGSPMFYMAYAMDEDFEKLFKVKVNFDIEMDRNKDNIREYVSFVSSLCKNENLTEYSKPALAKLIEYGSRLAGDQNKLSTQFNEVSDIVYESSAIAKSENSKFVEMEHVQKAIEEKRFRSNMYEEKMQEQIIQDKVVINTSGEVVGQINGLYVLQTVDYTFGLPARITAKTYMGRGGIINIEREIDMSGTIHSKGVLTLSGYLGGKLAQKDPMGFTAQVTFEQLYGGIDGDSASSAELYAILSSLADVPIKQCFAVTGSVDQRGEIQPIGGVNEKIEGFFDICSAKGLTGEQGVLIPTRNVDNLMLKDEVINAVKDNKFHIYAVKTIEEGIEILTGVEAGVMDENYEYPENTVFYRADRKLKSSNKKPALSES